MNLLLTLIVLLTLNYVSSADFEVNKSPSKDPAVICKLPPETGPCRASMPMWYFDPVSRTCKEFTYGGCNGNENKFSSTQDCVDFCVFIRRSTAEIAKSDSGNSGNLVSFNLAVALGWAIVFKIINL